MWGLTLEQLQLLEKFGFRVQGDVIVHKKLEVQLMPDELNGIKTLDALEGYIKDKLKNS